jgi:hypothetical protein
LKPQKLSAFEREILEGVNEVVFVEEVNFEKTNVGNGESFDVDQRLR